jgi:hypothetical protein
MNRKTAVIIALQAFLIIMLFWMLVFYGKDEYEAYTSETEEEIETPSLVSTDNGVTVVTLSEGSQKQSDIRTTPLPAGRHQNTLASFGTVVAIDPLIELRTRYLAAKAEAEVVRATLLGNRQEYERIRKLNADNKNVSDRAVLSAGATLRADEARLAAAEIAAASIRDSMRQQWGSELTRLATEQPASAALERLLHYREALLQITLPFDSAAPKRGDNLMVAPAAGLDKTIKAEFISVAPHTDISIPGNTYFYRAPAASLRTGMRVAVRMERADTEADGVIVPGSAIVWYGGKAWVYLKQGPDRFQRHAVDTGHAVNGGWFNSGTLQPGDELVTSGAQLLLSEEFKYQIKNENDD